MHVRREQRQARTEAKDRRADRKLCLNEVKAASLLQIPEVAGNKTSEAALNSSDDEKDRSLCGGKSKKCSRADLVDMVKR